MTHAFSPTVARAAVAALALSLVGCGSLDTSDDSTFNYRSGARKVATLDVPPDLSKLSPDGRYQVQAGTVSASGLGQTARSSATAASAIAPNQAGDVRIQRLGQQRWLVSGRTPETLWPQLRQFWLDMGFTLEVEDPVAGVMQTSWAENRAKLPQDMLREFLGRFLDPFSSTGERDQYRMRLERSAQGSEIYISHKGLQETVHELQQQLDTTWVYRPSDPNLEAEMLARVMVAISNTDLSRDTARSAVQQAAAASAPAPQARARAIADQAAATLQLDDGLERAWRRVGLALDRSGFTVEERDRNQGVYAVRYVDPAEAGKDGPGFWARLFGAEAAKPALGRYRIQVKANGANSSRISVLTPQGAPDNSANAQRIVTLLVDELKL